MNLINKRAFAALATLTLAASALSLAGCAGAPKAASIADTAAATPELSTLARLVGQAGLADTLRGPGPFTVFAPSDEAFKSLPAGTLEKLAQDKAMLAAVLTYHVVPAKVMAAEVKNGNVKTVQGANLAVAKSGDYVTVEDALVTKADVSATNGVVHIIDKVLMPPAPRR